MNRPEALLATIELVTGTAALGGAVYGLRGAPAVPKEWLEGSPFSTYAVPSVILATCVGGSMLAAADAVVRERPAARGRSSTAGAVLVAWIGVQVRTIGWRSPLQPALLAVGAATTALSWRLPANPER